MRVIYDCGVTCDCSCGGLRIQYPARDGFVEYTFVHSAVPEKNCDIWRMSVVSALDAKGDFLHPLTKGGAEWEMAIRLENRPDFIGGYNHGDEIGEVPVFRLDGEAITPEELSQWREFSTLEITVESTGFDPASPSVEVLKHHKSYVYDEDGVHLSQSVTWVKDAVLDRKFKSFLAMMPPLKHLPQNEGQIITDSFSFGGTTVPITKLPLENRETRRITVAGEESGFVYTMSVENYDPVYPNSYLGLLTDNGNMNYNKMYIAFAGGNPDEIPAGTVWNAVTHYKIEKRA